jgi:hypothetical protein
MNTFSHIILGRLLHQYIMDQRGIRLSRRGFVYGNVLPDFAPSFKKLPHEPEYWVRFLKSEIAGLSGSKREDTRFGVDYSRRLGIICHFYADFFCRAHTANFEGGAVPHILYEWDLHRYLRSGFPGLDVNALEGAGIGILAAGEIFSDFGKLTREYADLPPSYDKDISFALRACAGMLSAVTANSGAGDSAGEAFAGLPLTTVKLIVGAENSI